MMILKRAAAVPEHETKTGAPDRDATRSMLVAETLVSARFAAFVPAALTALLLVFFRGSSESLTLLGPLGVLCCLACGVTAAVAFAHPLALRRSADIVSRGAAVCALFAGTALGAIPLLAYAPADGDHRLLLLGTLGAAVANVAVLGPIASIGLLYLLPLLGGGVVGLARTGEPISIAVSLLLVVAGWVIMWAVRKRQALAARRIADGLRAAALGETVETLLLDVEAGTAEWIWETDASGRLRAVSERIAEAARLPVERLDGCPLKMIFTMQHPGVPMAEGARVVCETIAARKPFRNELVEVKTRDTSIWWRLTGKPVLDASGAFVGYRGVGCDITAARDTEARILQLATTDTLTGLANREQFQVHAERECTAAAVDGRWRALLFLDLDGFKSVNDALGHAAGDDVLREAARRLLQSVPRGCMVSRLGGDEFGIWYDAKTPSRAEALALDLIEALTVPFDVQGAQVAIGASVGIAFTPKHAVDVDSLLGKADLALYQAKTAGRGLHRIFIEEFELSIAARRELEGDLKLALARAEFELHYQPLVDLQHGEIVCFEALIRWTSPTRGPVSPADFIPAAEASGLITAIGTWVLFEACTEAARWPNDIHVAVNVSPQQFRCADFVQTVLLALKASGLPPNRLEIEVTEGIFLGNSASALDQLRELRRRGIQIALDDFGTGYSSLSYLLDFPVDKIKIDRSFVRGFATRRENQAIVDAILTLARKLAIRVTAEGVETAEQALALKLRRCDDIQGFLLSRPRAAADIDDMLATVPAVLRDIIPKGLESPLGVALAMKKQSA